ncbi:ABC-F family ATP-binding cassette domain-containing protein [Patescibacteria group bacterium]|nr:ABC-F family ATP-binding cassette domain-containing protein [Patescibacteria group bacterium]
MKTLIQINNLYKYFNESAILNNISLSINEKQKIALIGRNGCGKTTLLKIILGKEEIDSGEVQIFDHTRIGYLDQHNKYLENETVINYLLRVSDVEAWQCAKLAAKFLLNSELLEKKIELLSGGYQMRVFLTGMLLLEPNILLLDEPTNYLDLNTLLLLEKFLNEYNGSYIIISHDKQFLDNTCDRIIEIEHGKIHQYHGSIDNYYKYKNQKLETSLNQNKNTERQKKHLQKFVDRFQYKASKAKQAQSKIKQIKKLEYEEVALDQKNAVIILPKVQTRKGICLRNEELSIGYPEKIIANNINFDIHWGEHIAIVGDNGQGKTTYLKTLLKELPPVAGDFRWMVNVNIGYYDQYVAQTMNPKDSIESYLEAKAKDNLTKEELLKTAANFLFSIDDIKKSISVLSGGEKARLYLAGLLMHDYTVLLLDEPTNHLDFQTVETLAKALKKSNVTILFISHNRDFIKQVATNIIEVKNGNIKSTRHNYEDYLQYLCNKISDSFKEEALIKEVKSDTTYDKKISYELLKQSKKNLQKIEKTILTIEKKMERTMQAYAKENFTFCPIKDQDLRNYQKNLTELRQEKEKLEEDIILNEW